MSNKVKRIERYADDQSAWLVIAFTSNGVEGRVTLILPPDWDVWDRATRIAWGKQQIADHLAHYNYATAGEIIYPDLGAPEQAAKEFENLPGWATWTATEAVSWIDINVTDLVSAKAALEAMACAIIYLRDMVLER